MSYTRFAFYNVLGGAVWVLICVLAGYFLAENEWVKQRFEIVVLAIVFVSVLPMLFELAMVSWGKKEENKPAKPATAKRLKICAGPSLAFPALQALSEPEASATAYLWKKLPNT
jgi:hypothetical protein